MATREELSKWVGKEVKCRLYNEPAVIYPVVIGPEVATIKRVQLDGAVRYKAPELVRLESIDLEFISY